MPRRRQAAPLPFVSPQMSDVFICICVHARKQHQLCVRGVDGVVTFCICTAVLQYCGAATLRQSHHDEEKDTPSEVILEEEEEELY